MNINTVRNLSTEIQAGLFTLMIVAGVGVVGNRTIKEQKTNQVQQLKSYNLPADEFKKLSTKIQAQALFQNGEGFKILDSLALDKEKKQIFKNAFDAGKQFAIDSINNAQEKFAVKNYSTKVDTALKNFKK